MDEIILEIAPPFAHIRLNRPERRNAMSRAMWGALPGICGRIEAASGARVVIVGGAGGHFCAGADISEFDEVYRDAAAARDYVDAIQAALNALAALDRPVIAKIAGNCVGGGLAMAMVCDLRFCADDAFLAITPARLGLLYGFAETKRLVELVGPSRAKDLLFTGRRILPAEALAIGLADRTVAPGDLDASVTAFADELCGLSQHSIRGAKTVVAAISGGLREESAGFRRLVEQAAPGEDFSEGRKAFDEKRPAKFTFRGKVGPLRGA